MAHFGCYQYQSEVNSTISSGASSHHLCVWKLRSSCCSSHSLLLNTEIHVMVLIPSLLLLAFALTSSLCALYIGLRLVIRRHRSLLMLPDGLMTRTALYSSLSTCDDTMYYIVQIPTTTIRGNGNISGGSNIYKRAMKYIHPRIILCTIYNFVQHTYIFSFSVVSYYLVLTLDLLFVKSHHDACYNSIGYPKPPVYMIHIVFPHTYIQHQKLFHARREKELCKIAWKINTFSF